MRQARIAWILIALLASAAGVSAGSKAEKNFRKLSADILKNLQQFWPVDATRMGIHDYDHRFTDYSYKSVDRQRRQLREFLARLYKYKSVSLPRDMDIDRRLLEGNCDIATLRLTEIDYHKINPNLYLDDAADGIYSILIHEYAPLSERIDNVMARMRALPGFLEQGESNLAAPPPIWLDQARENVKNVVEFYRTIAEQLSEEFPNRAAELKGASDQAITALQHFGEFLNSLTPGEPGSFAIGKEYFNYILTYEHFFDFDADSMLKIGERLLAETMAEYQEYETQLDSADNSSDFPMFIPASISRQDVIDYYNWEIETVKNFVISNELITIPEDIGTCKVMETPVFLRGVIGSIAYEPPGPFDKASTGYFYIPPIPEDLSAERKEYYYKRMHDRAFRGAVVHEAYPGHHLQLQLAARVESDIRRWQMNNALIEGWALYCEQTAYEAGLYEDNPAAYRRVLRGVLFRAIRIIVDVKLHTGEFNYDQAVAWMSETLQADTSDTPWIKREVLRYTADPGQPMSYLMGKRAILELKDSVKKREGDTFDLKSFHDRLLSEGSIPIPLIREKMLK
jgi:uncharacterized protein (DUF885 family)